MQLQREKKERRNKREPAQVANQVIKSNTLRCLSPKRVHKQTGHIPIFYCCTCSINLVTMPSCDCFVVFALHPHKLNVSYVIFHSLSINYWLGLDLKLIIIFIVIHSVSTLLINQWILLSSQFQKTSRKYNFLDQLFICQKHSRIQCV